jgi:hypothetical protein
MVAHSAAPHGPTFTCAPSCASQRPLGSADAEPAQNSAKIVTVAAAQSLGSFMIRILSARAARASPNLYLTAALHVQKRPGIRPGDGAGSRRN